MTRYFVLAFLLLGFLSCNAEAATLFGRVIEVNDGDVITVFNLNRPVRIKLLAVDAPEAGQPFGDVAKKHLSDLVYDKSVLVEYWGIAGDGSLVGRITLEGADVGAQMIRDGAAWFDESNQGRLSAGDREVYKQSEQAARSEKRGLWQAESPIAPWEFVRAEALRRNPAASLNSILPAAKARRDGQPAELSSFTLLASRVTPSVPLTSRNDPRAQWASAGPPREWRQFKPANENFSALVPEGGEQMTFPSQFGGRQVNINIYAARDGWAVYGLMWLTAPSYGESDLFVIDNAVQEFVDGFNSTQRTSLHCELESQRRFSLNGFSATEYNLPVCAIPAKILAYTRVTRGVRQLYIGSVFYIDKDPNIERFMKSFTVSTPSSKTRH